MLLQVALIWQSWLPGHSLSGSAHSMTPQVPGPSKVNMLLQLRQRPLHAVLQQTPSTQKLLWQSAAAPQGSPFASFWHAPAPLHACAPLHSASGSAPTGTNVHVPRLPALSQASQMPVQPEAQHTPSMQRPVAHSAFWLHTEPCPSTAHVPEPVQKVRPTHSFAGS